MKKIIVILLMILIITSVLYKNKELATDTKPAVVKIVPAPSQFTLERPDQLSTQVETQTENNFVTFEKLADGWTQFKLIEEANVIDTRLSEFSNLNYDEFSKVQLENFNTLNQKKAVLLKKLIFLKYYLKYAGKM